MPALQLRRHFRDLEHKAKSSKYVIVSPTAISAQQDWYSHCGVIKINLPYIDGAPSSILDHGSKTMIFNWLDASKAVEFGIALADELVPRSGSDPLERVETKPRTLLEGLGNILTRANQGVHTTELNFYKRAKLANAFKWRLIENGIERATADEATQTLVMNLSINGSDQSATDQNDVEEINRPTTNNVKQLLAQGSKCMKQGADAEAIDIFERLLEIDPHHSIALNNLGAALSKVSQYREAEKYIRAAIKESPADADAHSNLGALLRCRGYFDDSEKSLRIALKLNPKHLDAKINLGMTLILLNRFREAKRHFGKVLKARPRSAEALFGIGQIESMQGRFEESEKIFKRALQARPKMPAAWAALSGLRKMTTSDEAWLQGAEEIVASGVPPMEAAIMHFAMGKYHDDVAQFAQAFGNYRDANEILKPIAKDYDRAARTAFVDELIRLHTRQTMAIARGTGSTSIKPVFVVGMMRSGTSLTEQIIASHPMAKGAGELDYWSKVAHELRVGGIEAQTALDEPAKRRVADGYLHALEIVSSTAARVVDKAPLNSDNVGLIHSILPNARIIFVQRDPIDTCLSSYFQNLSLAHSFALDLSDLAHYYREHHRLMNHWRTVLPQGSMLEVTYEGLVEDQEKWTRKILDFIGLEWDARCLNFQTMERPIVTASFWQARQKIFQTSVRRWRNYEKFLDPLMGLKSLQS
jgi:tetratricopeptide (TPR) repeat protein